MAVYSVLAPPPGSGERKEGPERFVFVRDGFGWAAFIFGGLWMLWRRLWQVLLGYLLVLGAFEVVFRLIGAPFTARIATGFLLALLVGLEAGSLQRFTLLRRGWRELGIVVADDLESAERRFFSEWVTSGDWPARSGANSSVSDADQTSVAGRFAGVFGLFPQPGRSR
jgi:hypothetical protein